MENNQLQAGYIKLFFFIIIFDLVNARIYEGINIKAIKIQGNSTIDGRHKWFKQTRFKSQKMVKDIISAIKYKRF